MDVALLVAAFASSASKHSLAASAAAGVLLHVQRLLQLPEVEQLLTELGLELELELDLELELELELEVQLKLKLVLELELELELGLELELELELELKLELVLELELGLELKLEHQLEHELLLKLKLDLKLVLGLKLEPQLVVVLQHLLAWCLQHVAHSDYQRPEMLQAQRLAGRATVTAVEPQHQHPDAASTLPTDRDAHDTVAAHSQPMPAAPPTHASCDAHDTVTAVEPQHQRPDAASTQTTDRDAHDTVAAHLWLLSHSRAVRPYPALLPLVLVALLPLAPVALLSPRHQHCHLHAHLQALCVRRDRRRDRAQLLAVRVSL